MKNFHSIKIYKFLLDFLWYGFMVVAGIWLIVNLFSVAFDGVVRAGDIFTFNVKAKPINHNPLILSDEFDFSVFKQTDIQVQLNSFKVNQIGKPFILLYIVAFTIGALLFIFKIKMLRDFLRNILNEKIFSTENVSKLKNIALLELLTILFSIIYYLIANEIFKNGGVLNNNFVFVTDYGGCFEPIVSALEYFVFAGVFSFGYKLKQEQDLTI